MMINQKLILQEQQPQISIKLSYELCEGKWWWWERKMPKMNEWMMYITRYLR